MFFFLYLLIRQPRPAPHTLSLHDALPISFDAGGGGWGGTKPTGRGEAVVGVGRVGVCGTVDGTVGFWELVTTEVDRKSTRLNSSHANISYAVFCLKKTKKVA